MLYWIGQGCSEREIYSELGLVTVLAREEGKKGSENILALETFCLSFIALDTEALLSVLGFLKEWKTKC